MRRWALPDQVHNFFIEARLSEIPSVESFPTFSIFRCPPLLDKRNREYQETALRAGTADF